MAKQVQSFLKEKHIYYSMKYGKNKANFVENKIRIIKRLLFIELRDNLSQNWPVLLPKIVHNYNNTPLKHLGFLCPNDIKNEADSMKVQAAQKVHNIKPYSEPTFHEQKNNQQQHQTITTNLKVGDYVYVDMQEKLFQKSFDIKERNI